MSRPPITGDVAEVIGEHAERVENRSLLFDKFVVHKAWPDEGTRLDSATRWSIIRATENGEAILSREKQQQIRRRDGRNTSEENRQEAQTAIAAIDALSHCSCRCLPEPVEEMRRHHVDGFVRLLENSAVPHVVRIGRLESRLAINLSDSLVQNAGICLDRLFGMPYIPGSAVKGVCRHAALALIRTGKLSLPDFQDVFGTADVDFGKNGELFAFADKLGGLPKDKKGIVDFFAAYPTTEVVLEVDLTNVHFSDYYRDGKVSSLSQENPKQNPFPVVKAGAEFAFCVALNSMRFNLDEARQGNLLEIASVLLSKSMEQEGFGAKTGAGYGWFTDMTEQSKREEAEKIAAETEARRKADEAMKLKAQAEAEEQARRSALSPEAREKEDLDNASKSILGLKQEDFAHFARDIASKSDIEKRAFVAVLKSDKDKKDWWKTKKKKDKSLAETVIAGLGDFGKELQS